MSSTGTAEAEGAPRDRLQIIAAVILGLAATLTALAVFNSSLRDGESLRDYTASTRALTDANFFWSQANEVYAGDFALFLEFAKAANADDLDLADYLFELMRPELQDAVLWWADEEAALDPFDLDAGSPYVNEDIATAQAIEAEAADLFEAAADANKRGDQMTLATVFFALTLFFGGIATLFASRAVTIGLLGASVATLGIGSIVFITAF